MEACNCLDLRDRFLIVHGAVGYVPVTPAFSLSSMPCVGSDGEVGCSEPRHNSFGLELGDVTMARGV